MKIKRFIFSLLFGLGLLLPSLQSEWTHAFGGKVRRGVVRVALTDYSRQMREIQIQGFDVAGVNFEGKQVDLVVNEMERLYLENHGFEILLSGLEAIEPKLDAQYKTPATVAEILRQLHLDHPSLTELVSVGKSVDNRDIWALKIANSQTNPAIKKPTLFVNGMHHAREVMTTEIVLDMAQYLLSSYGQDSKVTNWVDKNEIWLLPMLNVDGNNTVWTEDTWWRKNTRNGYGVDLNRNYAYGWNSCNGS